MPGYQAPPAWQQGGGSWQPPMQQPGGWQTLAPPPGQGGGPGMGPPQMGPPGMAGAGANDAWGQLAGQQQALYGQAQGQSPLSGERPGGGPDGGRQPWGPPPAAPQPPGRTGPIGRGDAGGWNAQPMPGDPIAQEAPQPWQDPTGQYTGEQMGQWTDERRNRYQQRADRGNLAGQGGNFDQQSPPAPDPMTPDPYGGQRGTGTALPANGGREAQVQMKPGGNKAAMQEWRRSNNPDQNKQNQRKWANANRKKKNIKNGTQQKGGLQKDTMGPSGGMGNSFQKESMGRTSKSFQKSKFGRSGY